MNKTGNKYDVLIIGAGISGLVCGAYLSKGGARVLLVEKNRTAGGYCSSIESGRFKFNLTTCTLGSLRKEGLLNKIYYQELGIKDDITVLRSDPSNTVVTDYGVFDFRSMAEEPKNELIALFPERSKDINDFFDMVLNAGPLSLYTKYKNMTFAELLDSFSFNENIKELLYITCGIFGTLPQRISAFSALIYFKETIFDGGYYIAGGAQNLPGALLKKIADNGGDVLFSTMVNKIKCGDNKRILSVLLDNGDEISLDYLVACCDAKEIFLKMMDKPRLSHNIANTVSKMEGTSSALITYIGLKKPSVEIRQKYRSRNVWFCAKNGMKEVFDNIGKNSFRAGAGYFLCSFSSSSGGEPPDQITVYVPAAFIDMRYWKESRAVVLEEVIKNIEGLIPGVAENIETAFNVTPFDLYDYSFNSGGALKGWASTPEQNHREKIPQGEIFGNLYTAGQWSTLESGQGGIAMASFSGRAAAKTILRHKVHERVAI